MNQESIDWIICLKAFIQNILQAAHKSGESLALQSHVYELLVIFAYFIY